MRAEELMASMKLAAERHITNGLLPKGVAAARTGMSESSASDMRHNHPAEPATATGRKVLADRSEPLHHEVGSF